MKRFWDKVEKTPTCWIWRGSTYPNGYGCINFNGRNRSVHRYAYELKNGQTPIGFLICHSCDNKLCVNPDHLFLGTYKDNWQDAVNKGIIKPVTAVRKLTPEQAIEIRGKYQTGTYQVAQLSREYGIGPTSIRRIIDRETYREI